MSREQASRKRRRAPPDASDVGDAVHAERLQEQRRALPIWQMRAELVALIRSNARLVVIGETGSGKTTQLPQFLHEAGFTARGCIACTQPRRVAAVSVAVRVATETGTALGSLVGYQVRFEERTIPATRIKYMTDGMLLREALSDPSLSRYSAVLVDEAHERSVHTDVLLGLLLQLSHRRPDLRLVVMSATLDAGAFSAFLGNCPIATVRGRTYPVRVMYLSQPAEDYVEAAMNATMQVHAEESPGDVLVFLTGQEEIEAVERLLRDRAEAYERASLLALAREHEITIRELDIAGEGGEGRGADAGADGSLPETSVSPGAPAPLSVDEAFDKQNAGRVAAAVAAGKGKVGRGGEGATAVALRVRGELEGRVHGSKGAPTLTTDALRSLLLSRGLPPTALRNARGGPLHLSPRPLFAALSPEAQLRAFAPAPSHARKAILATNIAETSVTVSGVRYVIDAGLVKSRGYSARMGAESLLVVPVSRAQAVQRSGRAGREAPGVAFRLYTEETFVRELAESTPPEILRSNLASVALQLKALGVDDPLSFPLMDRPPRDALMRALETLLALGALDKRGRLTETGRSMCLLPLDPMFSRALLKSIELGCSREVAAMAAMASVDHVFHAPRGHQREADRARQRFATWDGDHATLLSVMRAYLATPIAERHRWCRDCYVSARAVAKAHDVFEQLMRLMGGDAAHHWSDDLTSARRALTAGLFPHAARLQPDGTYRVLATRALVSLHPSSVLCQRKPEFVVFNEIVVTTRQYARGVCAIDGAWLPELAPAFFTRQTMAGRGMDDGDQ